MATLGERIRQVRGEMDLMHLAERIGVHKNTLSNYERGLRVPDANVLLKLLDVFPAANPGWLLTGQGGESRSSNGEETLEGFFLVPLHEMQTKWLREGKIVSEQLVNSISFKTDWVINYLGIPPQDLSLVSVKGDSMEPTLSDGDMVLADLRANRIEDNAVYVLYSRGALLVRRLHRKLDGSLIVKGDNQAYETEVLTEEVAEDLEVVGRVVWMGRKS